MNTERVLLWGLKNNLCRLCRSLTQHFPSLLLKRMHKECVFLARRILSRLWPGLPVAFLGGTWDKGDIEMCFPLSAGEKKTAILGWEPGWAGRRGAWFGDSS